jgi:hypothetical protein
MADRGEVIKVGIPTSRILETLLRLPQLSILHLELDLMNLKIVNQSFGFRSVRVQPWVRLQQAKHPQQFLFRQVFVCGCHRDGSAGAIRGGVLLERKKYQE